MSWACCSFPLLSLWCHLWHHSRTSHFWFSSWVSQSDFAVPCVVVYTYLSHFVHPWHSKGLCKEPLTSWRDRSSCTVWCCQCFQSRLSRLLSLNHCQDWSSWLVGWTSVAQIPPATDLSGSSWDLISFSWIDSWIPPLHYFYFSDCIFSNWSPLPAPVFVVLCPTSCAYSALNSRSRLSFHWLAHSAWESFRFLPGFSPWWGGRCSQQNSSSDADSIKSQRLRASVASYGWIYYSGKEWNNYPCLFPIR